MYRKRDTFFFILIVCLTQYHPKYKRHEGGLWGEVRGGKKGSKVKGKGEGKKESL